MSALAKDVPPTATHAQGSREPCVTQVVAGTFLSISLKGESVMTWGFAS